MKSLNFTFFKKNFFPSYLSIAFSIALLLSSCSSISQSQTLSSTEEFIDKNEISSILDDSETVVMATINHAPVAPTTNSNGDVEFTYNGGILELPYYVSTTGDATNIGFLIFLNGIPQPYSLSEEGSISYCHTINTDPTGEAQIFSFFFSPITGTAGDTLDIQIASIYNPQFQPDLVTSFGYGNYHQVLTASYKLTLLQTPPVFPAENKLSPIVENMEELNSDLTPEIFDSVLTSVYGISAPDLNTLDTNVYLVVQFDTANVYNSVAVSRDSVHIDIYLCGIPNAKYRIVPYINHLPIAPAQEVTLQKGSISVIGFDISASALSTPCTFYAIASPIEPSSYNSTDLYVPLIKSQSVLLYVKEG